jgi:hypothetical protein
VFLISVFKKIKEKKPNPLSTAGESRTATPLLPWCSHPLYSVGVAMQPPLSLFIFFICNKSASTSDKKMMNDNLLENGESLAYMKNIQEKQPPNGV